MGGHRDVQQVRTEDPASSGGDCRDTGEPPTNAHGNEARVAGIQGGIPAPTRSTNFARSYRAREIDVASAQPGKRTLVRHPAEFGNYFRDIHAPIVARERGSSRSEVSDWG